MFDLDKINEIIQTISRNRTRSFLTAFGVFWGIFMLVVLVGGGNGLDFMLKKQIGGFAKNSCFINPGITSEAYKGFKKGRYWNFNTNDVVILSSQIPEIEDVSGMLFSNDQPVIRGERTGKFSPKGLLPSFAKINSPIILKGRYINDIDVFESRKVCVIGKKVYETLFMMGEDPIGQQIQVSGIFFTVIGLMKPYSENVNIGGNDNESIVMPLPTMQRMYQVGNYFHLLAFTAKKGHSISEIEEKVKVIIKREHKIAPYDEKAVYSMNFEKQFKMFENLLLGVNILIWIVGLGTLIAGVIGVSNIMMVTVKERTQEIGVRRALGAKPSQILSQILAETAVLTGIAGLLGISFGVLILQMVDVGMGKGETAGFMMPFWTAIMAVFVLISLSLMAGLLPAVRAVKIKAIDALRDE